MIRVLVEVLGGATPLTVPIKARTLLDAIDAAKKRYAGSEVRVIFPISPEEFFVKDANALRTNKLEASKEAVGRSRGIR